MTSLSPRDRAASAELRVDYSNAVQLPRLSLRMPVINACEPHKFNSLRFYQAVLLATARLSCFMMLSKLFSPNKVDYNSISLFASVDPW